MDIKQKLKTSWLFRILFVFVVIIAINIWYIVLPILIVWWFYKKSKFSLKFKKITTIVVIGFIALISIAGFTAYALDEEPTLVIKEPNSPSTVRLHQVSIKGSYTPLDSKVWVNGKKVNASGGGFDVVYQLSPGENKFNVEAGDWKRTNLMVVVTRELTEEEKAAKITSIPTDTRAPTSRSTVTDSPVKATSSPIPTTQEKQTKDQNTSPVSGETVSQKNAIRKAKSYLDYTGFSHDGLVAQLEYEQFSHADAIYGADNSGANWNEQAAKKAKSYMEYSAFSRGSLIEQLKYEKFTQEQAEYGANAVGL